MCNKTCIVVSSDIKTWGACTKDELLFVQETVLEYSQSKLFDTNNNFKFLEELWDTDEYRLKNKDFVKRKIKKYRAELYKVVSNELDIKITKQGWNIIFDYWGFHFVSIIYDRINILELTKDHTDDLYIIRAIQENFTIKTSNDFVSHCMNDNFNQYLYCEAAKILEIEVLNGASNNKDAYSYQTGLDFLSRVKKKIYNFLWLPLGVLIKLMRPILVVDGYFPLLKGVLITIMSLGRVMILPKKVVLPSFEDVPVNILMRGSLKVSEADKYDMLCNRIINQCFPLSIFEGFEKYSKKVHNLSNVVALGSAIGFYAYDEYKILASQVLNNQGKIVGFQHGGTYGVFDFYLPNISINAMSKYYFWNSKSSKGGKLPAQHLEKIKKYKKNNGKKKYNILFVSTIFSRYPKLRYKPFCQKTKLFNQQLLFYNGLTKKLRSEFILRPNAKDLGWSYNQRWIDYTDGKIVFDQEFDFYKSIANKKLVVLDHISTTWIEALYFGVPLVMYFDFRKYDINSEMIKQFELLESVSVLHKNPDLASKFVNDNFDSLDLWWNAPEVSNIIYRVKNYLFNEGGDFVSQWSDELIELRNKCIKK